MKTINSTLKLKNTIHQNLKVAGAIAAFLFLSHVESDAQTKYSYTSPTIDYETTSYQLPTYGSYYKYSSYTYPTKTSTYTYPTKTYSLDPLSDGSDPSYSYTEDGPSTESTSFVHIVETSRRIVDPYTGEIIESWWETEYEGKDQGEAEATEGMWDLYLVWGSYEVGVAEDPEGSGRYLIEEVIDVRSYTETLEQESDTETTTTDNSSTYNLDSSSYLSW